MKIDSIFLGRNCVVHYNGRATKRQVKAAMREARRAAQAKGITVVSVRAFKRAGHSTKAGYSRQYSL